MENKSPAFQWYPKDILASARVAEMSLEEEGAYRRALDFCWLNGSLPSDTEKLARVIGKGASILVATIVQAMFIKDPNDPSRLLHERLEIERKKQEEWRKKSAKGGKNSAHKRKKIKELDKQQGASVLVATKPQPNGNTPVFSLQSSISANALKSERDPSEVNPDLKTDFSSYYKSVAAALQTNLLPNEHRWLKVFEQSETEKVPPESLTASLKILLSQKRDYPVTPENAFSHAIEKRAKNSLETGFMPVGEPRRGLLSDQIKR